MRTAAIAVPVGAVALATVPKAGERFAEGIDPVTDAAREGFEDIFGGLGSGLGQGFRDLFAGAGLGAGEGAAAGLSGIAKGVEKLAVPLLLVGGGVLVFAVVNK